jgi:hypothetical protein
MQSAVILLALVAIGVCAWVVIADHRPTWLRASVGIAALTLAIAAITRI